VRSFGDCYRGFGDGLRIFRDDMRSFRDCYRGLGDNKVPFRDDDRTLGDGHRLLPPPLRRAFTW
jgi:hypothetical protein